MEIIIDIHDFKATPCAATVGSFDGVHLGHKAMIAELREAAARKGLPLTVVTFARHPRLLFNVGCEPFLLTTNSEKIALLESVGVDRVVLLDFDAAMASMCAEQFMREVLVDALGVKLLGVGYDHHFGRPCDGEGLEQYMEYGRNLGVEVLPLSQFTIDGENVGSSAVRRALVAGDLSKTLELLGHRFVLEGTVVHGAGIGRHLGFPTANVQLAERMMLLPADGVYEVEACVDTSRYKGVMNVGFKPTVDNSRVRTIEVHLIGFSGDIYGKAISVELLRRLREEKNFESVDALRLQIEADVARVISGI